MSLIVVNPYSVEKIIPGYELGQALEGGYFAGFISHTANGDPTHALIVSPKEVGETPISLFERWSVNNGLTGADSLYDGRYNTDILVGLGINNYPAAKFCVDLNIEGYTDWYLPALLEFEIAFFNLKPFDILNDTSVRVNPYAVPPRLTNYTPDVPGQTSVDRFIFPWAEPFPQYLDQFYNVSTDLYPNSATIFSSGNGSTFLWPKISLYHMATRAFRRIAL